MNFRRMSPDVCEEFEVVDGCEMFERRMEAVDRTNSGSDATLEFDGDNVEFRRVVGRKPLIFSLVMVLVDSG